MEEETIVKICVRCKTPKPLSEFYIDRSRKDGHTYWCKLCIKGYQKSVPEKRKKWSNDHYVKNKEKILKRQKELRLKNPKEYREKHRKSYQKHREERLKKFKEYREKNPKKYNDPKKIYCFLHGRNNNPTSGYLDGDGCCLYCGEINPFLLENHHPFGKKEHSEFIITLCANHHLPFKRFPKMLENWGEPIFK